MTEQDFIKIMHKKATFSERGGEYEYFHYKDFQMWGGAISGRNIYSHTKLETAFEWDVFLERVEVYNINLNILTIEDTALFKELYD